MTAAFLMLVRVPIAFVLARVFATGAILKTGKAKAIRFSTLAALCRALDCQPGDIMTWEEGEEEA